jgi:uncharacterized YigZ family protein
LRRVEAEESARELVTSLRKQHWDARHHCSAFVLGPDGALQRSSDDGEPAGTAGAPMLEVLRGAEVSDVVAVVTRWFGGTLLGAGGLVRAYSDSVRAGLAEAGTIRRDLLSEQLLVLDHASGARVEADLRSRGFEILEVHWAEHVELLVGVAPDAVTDLEAAVAQVTQGSGVLEPMGSRWVDAS